MYDPWLTTCFGYYPATLATDISEREGEEGEDREYSDASYLDREPLGLAVRYIYGEGEEEEQPASDGDHDVEGIESEAYVGYSVFYLVEVSVAEVFEVLLEFLTGLCGYGLVIVSLSLVVCVESFVGYAATLNPFGVGNGVDGFAIDDVTTLDNILDARDKSVWIVATENTESSGDTECKVHRGLVVVPSLLWVDYAKSGQGGAFLTFVETFHGGELHGLGLGDVYGGLVAAPHGEQYASQAYDASYFDAIRSEASVASF